MLGVGFVLQENVKLTISTSSHGYLLHLENYILHSYFMVNNDEEKFCSEIQGTQEPKNRQILKPRKKYYTIYCTLIIQKRGSNYDHVYRLPFAAFSDHDL